MSLKKLVLSRYLVKCRVVNFTAVITRKFYKKAHEKYSEFGYKRPTALTLFGAALVGSALAGVKQSDDKNKTVDAGAKRADLPTFTAEEVSKHDSKSSFWVTYKHGVYDVTKFLPSHPGGEQILNAAGLSIEPFWNVYGMHKTEEVFKLLESYRIGNLHDDDVIDQSDEELWVKEPFRDKRLIVKTAKPFNAETPPEHQISHFNTPNEVFYVRQHMPVPELAAGGHRLRVVVAAGVGNNREFSLEDLGKMPQTTVCAALMCAGNRRSEMTKQVPKPVKGISWEGGAVGNAVWGGVLLREVLVRCGVDLGHTEGKHVIFAGADIDATGVNFSTSIPLSMAADKDSRILLCTSMNGTALLPDHGRPLRVIVPGAPAVRSVKWLESITIAEEESGSHWHKKDYRSFNASKDWSTADFAAAPPVYSLPVTSAICRPSDGDTVGVKGGCVQLKGYAYSGGGAKVVRVDVSADQGQTWVEAKLNTQDDSPPPHHYSWTLWDVDLPVPPGRKQVEIWAKATDSNFNTQPERFDHIWNIRGILSNAYHRINVKLTR